MTSILIVDDTYEKIRIIAENIKDLDDVNLSSCLSLREALTALSTKNIDILIVDIQIPDFVGGEISRDGGKRLIERVMLDENLNLPRFIIGVTSHEDSYDENIPFFRKLGWQLLKDFSVITSIIKTQIYHLPKRNIETDSAIVTALRKTELEAVLNLPFDWHQKVDADNTIFYFGNYLDKNSIKRSVVAASCSRMGMAASASLTMKICERFRPKNVFMTGIAAGIRGKVKAGDILIADPTWDWGSGKRTVESNVSTFLISPHQLSIPDLFRQRFRELCVERRFLDGIYNEWRHPGKPDHSLQVHMGPIACGSSVLADKNFLGEVIKQNREIIGVDMEGYGVKYACNESSCSPNSFIIKSVCDFADELKDDGWQPYAAYTSAKYVEKLLTHII